MALSLSNFLYALSVFSLLPVPTNAATHTYNWTAGWVTANPDNAFDRPVMGINGQWPLPLVNITKGDRVIVNLKNDLGNQSTSLHFHGLYQNGTTYMDGVVGVTQCGVPPGSSFTYNFTVEQSGTYWYHSHVRGQYPDGLRGPIIVQDPESPYLGQYDEEFMMSLSDWYHEQMPPLIKSFISVTNPTGAEPVPKAALMNDSQNVTFSVEPGKTYLFHIVNMGAFAGQYLWFEGHTMEIVEVDGIWTERAAADMIYLGAAQRYSVLVTTKNSTDQNFAIVSSMDQSLFDVVPPTLNPNVTGWLVYDNANTLPVPSTLDTLEPFDDFSLVPSDHELLFQDVSQTVTLDLKMDNLGNGANYAFFNDITYVSPKVPTLYSVLTTGTAAQFAEVYGRYTNSFVLAHNEVVELVLNNHDSGKHPFHLHGHAFQVISRSAEDAGDYNPNNQTDIAAMPTMPMRRDVLVVLPNGHFAIRFRSDNPGVWLFHCHIEWHVDSGLIATIVEAPMQLQQSLQLSSLPADHLAACQDEGTPTSGNAAANTVNFYDLQGAPAPPAPLPSGFTARGIVALVFSCISAFLGIFVIGWYGAKPLSEVQERKMERNIDDLAVGVSVQGKS